MSLLSTFIAKHLVKSLEQQFVAHLPEAKEELLNEVTNFADIVTNWVNEKVKEKEASQNGKEGK